MELITEVITILYQNWVEILKGLGLTVIFIYVPWEIIHYLFSGDRPISGISDKRTDARYERYVNRNGRF